MNHDHEHYHKPKQSEKWWQTPNGIVAIFFFAASGYFLITEHGAHIVPFLPYLILLLCPVMHIFMHGGHGGHGGNHNQEEK